MSDDTETTKPFGGHFLVRGMKKEDKDAITTYGRSQGMKNCEILTAMLGLYEDLMTIGKRPEGASARLLLERHGLTHNRPVRIPTEDS